MPPPKSLKEAGWGPFLEFMKRDHAISILGFILFYKIADNLATALLRPFLFDMGYTSADRGIGLSIIAPIGTLIANFIGGIMTNFIGLGRALWIFGFIQAFASLGYVWVANASGVNRPLMYGATLFENIAIGMASGAFGVLLFRITQKKFALTQFAFFTCLFGIPRMIAGPIAGYAAHSLGWSTFFWLTIPTAIPGLLFLNQFSPFGRKEPLELITKPST
jgi:PAT family beta-lactamase induction signal transducer AmpG